MYDYQSNMFAGFCGVTVYFLILSIMAFPNGPFTRPHPIFWRLIFGLSVIYLMLIQFLIQQDYATVRSIIVWVDPKMENYTLDMEKARIDIFATNEIFFGSEKKVLNTNSACNFVGVR